MPSDVVKLRLAVLRDQLQGRAAGAWRVVGNGLEQVAFDPAPDLSLEVAEGFARATRLVGLSLVDLGIVKAVLSGGVVVSLASELPAELGSGYWLRAFEAARSVAVPILEEGGQVAFVVSVALGLEPSDEGVASILRRGVEPLDSTFRDETGHFRSLPRQ